MAFSKQNLQSLITVAVENGASDVHIRMDESPAFRIRGELIPVQTKAFAQEDIVDLLSILLGESLKKESLDKISETDGSFEIEDLCRLRFNSFRYSGKTGVVLRIVSMKVPSVGELGLPPIIKTISNRRRGLVMVTGATGSGKSTTLASMIDHINETRGCHIVTIEDPVEYLHSQKKSRISQREVGSDTHDFTSALRSALRQDPDVILIGEMRDPETVGIALKAAETGHAVFSTVHTTDAISTIGRIISMFPPEEQDEVRKRLSENLTAIVSQRMLKAINKKKVVIAQEIMINNTGVKECIMGKEPLSRINTIIAQGRTPNGEGSQTFDQHIINLYERGVISKETALSAATSQTDFLKKMVVD